MKIETALAQESTVWLYVSSKQICIIFLLFTNRGSQSMGHDQLVSQNPLCFESQAGSSSPPMGLFSSKS